MSCFRCVLFVLAFIQSVHMAQAETVWKTLGFSQPETALYDTERGRIIVSNLDGLSVIGKKIYFSDWMNGNLFSFTEGGVVKKVGAMGSGVANISSYDGRLLAPHSMKGSVELMDAP